jgi:carbon monoxide dehydrogenase subunit G
MQFVNTFDVAAPLDEVWKTVLDVERVAPTVPGAKVLEKTGDNSYKVSIKVKVGPMSMTYKGDVEIVEADEAEHRAVMRARAKESRGQGTADADVVMTLSGEDGRTAAKITTDVDLSGKVATMGQGVLQDVSGRLVDTFAKNLATMLETGEAPAAEAPKPKAAPEAKGAAEPGAKAEARAEEIATEAADKAEAEAGRPREAPPAFEGEEALDLGELGGAMVAEKLREPRNLAIALGIVALVFYLLGRRSARR